MYLDKMTKNVVNDMIVDILDRWTALITEPTTDSRNDYETTLPKLLFDELLKCAQNEIESIEQVFNLTQV